MRNFLLYFLLFLLIVIVAVGAYFLGTTDRGASIADEVASVVGVGPVDVAPQPEVIESSDVVDDIEPVDEEAEYAPFNIRAYNASKAAKRWAVYLDDKLSALEFINYDVVVFDSHRHPKLRPLEHQGKALLARMNFFFLDGHENFYSKKETDAVLFEEKKDGRVMKFVDIRNTEWLRIMIEKKIPHLTNMGFNGLLLEGVDDAVRLEREHPEKYFGMIEALGRFIRTVKQHFPYLKIMLKDSMRVTSIARDHVDMILFVQSEDEGLLSAGGQERTYAWMGGIKQHVPDVEFYSLDFIDMEKMSKEDVKALYAKRRLKGLIPYVAQDELKGHYVEPF